MKIEKEDIYAMRDELAKRAITFNGFTWNDPNITKLVVEYQLKTTNTVNQDYTRQMISTLEILSDSTPEGDYTPPSTNIYEIFRSLKVTPEELFDGIAEMRDALNSIHRNAIPLISYLLYEKGNVNLPCFVIYGVGGNGKGVVMQDIVKSILKKSMVSFDTSDCSKNEIYRILGTDKLRIIYEDEAHLSKMNLQFRRFYKTFTEGSEVTVKALYKNTMTGTPKQSAIMVISSNESIEEFVNSANMKRRCFVMHFDKKFSKDADFDRLIAKNKKYVPILCKCCFDKTELRLIHSICEQIEDKSSMESTARALTELLNDVPSYESFLLDIKTGSDDADFIRIKEPIDDFIDIFCVYDDSCNTICSELWARFQEYMKANREKPTSVYEFGKLLAKRGIYKKKNCIRIGHGREAKKISAYHGIRFRE